MLFFEVNVAAQNYPTKPIRMLAPEIGGASDIVARLIAHRLSASLGPQVVVDNRGSITPELGTKAPSDGHTILAYGSPLWLTGFLRNKVPGDPVKSFAPITLAAISPNLLVVHPAVAVHSVKDLFDLAKAKPAEINYAIGGARGYALVVMEQLKRATGINVAGVPYKALGADLSDVIAGQVSIAFNFWAILEPLAKAGRLRVLAIATPNRLPAAPDIPTFAEAGAPGVELLAWIGLFAPTSTPRDIITRIHKGFAQIIQTPAFKVEL